MEEIDRAVENGEPKGKWQLKQIDEPNMKGYVIKGHFSSNQPGVPFDPLNPIEPWTPLKRRPLPRRRFEPRESSLQEPPEPLTDIFEEKDTIKLYVEFPGEEKDDIHLNLTKGHLEVKGKNSYNIIDLPTRNIDIEKASSTYKNGVLQVIIPKKNTALVKEEQKIKIE